MRQRNLDLIPEGSAKSPLSVTHTFDPPEGVKEDSNFFSSLTNPKTIFLNDSSLKKIGIDNVKAISISDKDSQNKFTDKAEKNILLEQQQMMIESGKDTIFVSPSCLACYDQNLFVQIYEKGKQNE